MTATLAATLPDPNTERICHATSLRLLAHKMTEAGAPSEWTTQIVDTANELELRYGYEKANGALVVTRTFNGSYCDVFAPTGHPMGTFYAPDIEAS